jgi:hypothetical protein
MIDTLTTIYHIPINFLYPLIIYFLMGLFAACTATDREDLFECLRFCVIVFIWPIIVLLVFLVLLFLTVYDYFKG